MDIALEPGESDPLSVGPPTRHDRFAGPQDISIRHQVHRALRMCSYAGLCQVRFRIDGATVRLHGTVSTFYLKQVAQEAVGKLNGVERVVNQIVVAAPSDEEESFQRG
jgi:osmotically-inducible protein OsmY